MFYTHKQNIFKNRIFWSIRRINANGQWYTVQRNVCNMQVLSKYDSLATEYVPRIWEARLIGRETLQLLQKWQPSGEIDVEAIDMSYKTAKYVHLLSLKHY